MFPTCAIHDFNKEGWIDTKLFLDYHLSAAARSAFLLFSIRFMKDDADKSHTSERHDGKQEFANALFAFFPLQPRQNERGLDVCTELVLGEDVLSCTEHHPEFQGTGNTSTSATGS